MGVSFQEGVLSIENLQHAIERKQVTAEQIAAEYIQAIEKLNPEINAYTTINSRAVEEARALDTSDETRRAALWGVPIAIKDAIETAGLPSAFGSNGCRDYVPKQDATVVRLLRENGAVLTGKTACPDWCLGFLSHSSRSGITRNPCDTSRDTGGSSSGSAAAVASKLAVAAIGTDTAGSIRVPGAFNGLVGVMLTPGRVSRAGVARMIPYRDTVCPIANSVEDCARIFDTIVAYDARDPATSINYTNPVHGSFLAAALHPPKPKVLRLGVLKSVFGANKSILDLLSATLSRLSQTGITLVDIPAIPGLDTFRTKTFVPERIESAVNQFLSSRPDLSHLSFRDLPLHELNLLGPAMVAMSTGLKEGDEKGKIDQVSDLEREWKEKFGAVFAEHKLDGIIFPTMTCLAPKVQDVLDRKVNVFNLAGMANTDIANSLQWPAMTIPIGKVKDEGVEGVEMPVGLDLLGMDLRDVEMLSVGAAIEKALKVVSVYT